MPGLEPSLSGSRLTGFSRQRHPDTTRARGAVLGEKLTTFQEVWGLETIAFPASEVCQKFAGDFRLKLHALDPDGRMASRQETSLSAVDGTRQTLARDLWSSGH